jgi:aryl-alcohol dehydrogenase-like predicted oxidoreductase
MQYVALGRTGLTVSRICLGTMTWGQQNTPAEGHAQMDYALDQGINFFDTAELYPIPPKRETQGATERVVGSWLKARGARDKVILATKVIGRSEMDWFRDDGSPGELSRRQIEEAVDKSLRRLETDYIDLYQIHWPDRPMPWGANPTIYRHREGASHPVAETLAILGDLVKAGKIRHVGLSNESAWGTMTFLKEAGAPGSAARAVGPERLQSPQPHL